MCVSIHYSRHEAFSCTAAFSKKLVNWQNSTQYPTLGPTAARIVGFVVLPFATIADVSIHLSFVVAKTMTGIFITPYNFIVTCINPAYKAPREWELHSAFIHLAQALIHLSAMPFLPLINFASPEWGSSCMQMDPFQLTQNTSSKTTLISTPKLRPQEIPPKTPPKRGTLEHHDSFEQLHDTCTPPIGTSTPDQGPPTNGKTLNLYYSTSPEQPSPQQRISNSVRKEPPIPFNLGEIGQEDAETNVGNSTPSIVKAIDSCMGEIIQECDLSMSGTKGIIPPPICKELTVIEKEEKNPPSMKDPIPGLSKKVNLAFKKCFSSILGEKNPVYLSSVKEKLETLIEKLDNYITDLSEESTTQNPQLDLSTETVNNMSFLNITTKEALLNKDEEGIKKIYDQLKAFQKQIIAEDNKLKRKKETITTSSNVKQTPPKTNRRHSVAVGGRREIKQTDSPSEDIEELRMNAFKKIDFALGKKEKRLADIRKSTVLTGSCSSLMLTYYSRSKPSSSFKKFDSFEGFCQAHDALVLSIQNCEDATTLKKIQQTSTFLHIEALLDHFNSNLK